MRARSAAALKRRLEQYLRLGHLSDRRELVLDILPAFRRLGPTAIVGGMVRDLARAGPAGYSSDIDLVVDPLDYPAFRNCVLALGGRENRFGGFGLTLGSWKVDVWALRDTWARTAGHRRVETFADLVECTFFDWDAVVYDLDRRAVIARSGYFERLGSGVLGLNLRPNPNELGSAVRAVRRAVLWRAALSAELVDYVTDVERRRGWAAMQRLDAEAFAKPVLRSLDRSWVAASAAGAAWGPAAGPAERGAGPSQGHLWRPS